MSSIVPSKKVPISEVEKNDATAVDLMTEKIKRILDKIIQNENRVKSERHFDEDDDDNISTTSNTFSDV